MTKPKYPYETATPKQKVVGSWWWCVHHTIHLEQLTERVESRVLYIKMQKPKKEHNLRLRELAPVLRPEKLPKRLTETWAEYLKAEATLLFRRAEAVYAEYLKAQAECEPELAALHREEYPGTQWDGKSIFAEKVRD